MFSVALLQSLPRIKPITSNAVYSKSGRIGGVEGGGGGVWHRQGLEEMAVGCMERRGGGS